jgi:hypothetical protein
MNGFEAERMMQESPNISNVFFSVESQTGSSHKFLPRLKLWAQGQLEIGTQNVAFPTAFPVWNGTAIRIFLALNSYQGR